MKEITDLNEIKTIQLDILRNVHDFCANNDLTYFLSHGTLIGALRHRGFIPWDDDIDIFMPREDYERFCMLFPKSESELHLKLANADTKPFYGRAMSKVFDVRTRLVEPNYKGDDELGLNIDVWPLDGVPDNEKKRIRHLNRIKIYQKCLYGHILKFDSCEGFLQKLVHIIMLPIPTKFIIRRINCRLMRYRYSDSTVVTCAVDPYKKSYKKEWFARGVLTPFENAKVYIPNGAVEILEEIYGEYMVLPPEDQRKPHHNIKAFWRDEILEKS